MFWKSLIYLLRIDKGVERKMKCKYVFGIIVIAASVVIFKRDTVFAEQLCLVQGTGNGEMTIEQMLQSYEWYSGAGRQIRSDLYLAALEEQSAREGKAEAESDTAKIQVMLLQLANQKEQLENAEKELETACRILSEKEAGQGLSEEESEQKAALEQAISEHKERLAALEEQMNQLEVQESEREFAMISARLGWKQKAFYTENREHLADIRMKALNYALLSKAWNLALLQKQQEYYASCEELLDLRKKVNEIKEKHGISFEEIEKNELFIEEKKIEEYLAAAKEKVETTTEELRKETGLERQSLIFSYQTTWNSYDEKTVVNRFLENSEVYLQLEYYRSMYQEYGQELPPEEAQAREQARALVENYEIKAGLNRKQLAAYAREMLSAYDKAERELSLAEKNCEVCRKKYFAECKKSEYGRATRQSVLESRIEMEKAELDYLQCVIEKVQMEYILENGVEVQK